MQIVTKEVGRMRDQRAGGGNSFYGQSGGRQVFNPGNTSPFSVPRTEAVPKRVGRNPTRALVTWAALVVVVAAGAKYGYPLVMDQVHAKETSAVRADLDSVAAGEESYFKLNGSYGTSFESLGLPRTVNQVTVLAAAGSAYCLKGQSVTGDVTLYYSSQHGVGDQPCA